MFPALHSLEKPPFYAVPPLAPEATVGGMPFCNALFAFLWYNAFIKFVNLGPYICPSQDANLDVLFERKIPNPDGSPSDVYVINEHMVARFVFNVACSLNASAGIRKEKKAVFRTHVAILKGAAAKGKDWRAQLRDCLKLWEPEFSTVIKRKRRVGLKDDVQAVVQEMQVDPALL